MRLFISAKPGAKAEKVERVNPTHFVVSVREPPIRGKANKAVMKALADFLGVAPSRLRIVAGHTGRRKVIEI